jgi:hypothetical protein
MQSARGMSQIPRLPIGFAGSAVGFWEIQVCFSTNLSVSAENPVGFFKNRFGPARNRLGCSQTRPDLRQPKPFLSPIRSGSERNRLERVQFRPEFQPFRLGSRQIQRCPPQGEFAITCASCRNSARRRAARLQAGVDALVELAKTGSENILYIKGDGLQSISPLPLRERSTRAARRERGRRRRRLLRRRHPLPNPSPIKGEGLKRLSKLSTKTWPENILYKYSKY